MEEQVLSPQPSSFQATPFPRTVTDDLDALLDALPPRIAEPLRRHKDRAELLEVVMDMGRLPEARFLNQEIVLSPDEVTEQDMAYVVSRIGIFGGDNRAGIPRTLHRISAIRNRKGAIVGLTCRVGRAVFGTIRIIEDLIGTGKSILLMGKPGVGKTTMLRELARVMSEQFRKRVVVVDTSNEIGGDGDIPHPGIGRARRMQVPTPALQHAVMIEAVENHMPQAIIIDEIGTELEASAARTIAERGVQLVATAHGNTLENLAKNPTLADLVGGIQAVTLGDEEARRRGTQKTILERKAPPTFEIVVEIQNWNKVAVHLDTAEAVDSTLRGRPVPPEVRDMDDAGNVVKERTPVVEFSPSGRHPAMGPRASMSGAGDHPRNGEKGPTRIYPFGVSRGGLDRAIRAMGLPAQLVDDARHADVIITTKSYYRRRPVAVREAEGQSLPIFVLRTNSPQQIEQSLLTVCNVEKPQPGASNAGDPLTRAMQEAEVAARKISVGDAEALELSPQTSYIRRLQHQVAERFRVSSHSDGREPFRRVRLFRGYRHG
ncbi:MAG: R3H domain-containing nucleic acid-binding protein [Dehalococcoidia bacterium]|nr:R3H domain-containing nucleic acid-binding protein [Dehalococcoidia bacterium]